MARVFISHSSRDGEAAKRIRNWLTCQGFQAPFLDFDKHAGIPPGADWERTLYREIERSPAVIIIQTPNWMASKWCFAEYTQARALGKAIFPVIEAPTGETLIAPDIQVLDLQGDREGGLERLARELTRIALDEQGGFDWDRSRPPYPGLSAFQEQDAAVYFGRDDDIRRLIERLNARRVQGGARLIALLGASGSGKSSLLRAGVIPRLRRARRNWFVLPPMRPQTHPVDELARIIALGLGDGGAWRDWRRRLDDGDLAPHLRGLAADLRIRAGMAEARILVAIDQAEELYAAAEPTEAARFFEILSAMLTNDLPFMAVLAQRSDYLQELQSAPYLSARFEEFSLGPMSLARVPQIIEGPARIAGLEIAPALVQAATADAETEDALPLLAFALRELFDRFGADGHLSLDDYNALGDAAAGLTPLENAVRRAADGVLEDARPSAAELAALRDAFVPKMVRINDKGEYVRAQALLTVLPKPAHPLLQSLADARLLITSQDGDERVVEVAHEALLRKWPRLRGWLDEAREFLSGRQQLQHDLQDWQRAAESDKPTALLNGLKLGRARGWLEERPHQLGDDERGFIEASIVQAEAVERRVARLRRRIVQAALAVSLVLAIVAGLAVRQTIRANDARADAQEQAGLALSRKLASDARLELLAGRLETALLLAAEGYSRARTAEAEAALYDIVESQPDLLRIIEASNEHISALEFTPDGGLLAGDFSGAVSLLDGETGEKISEFKLDQGLSDFEYDREGKRLAVTGHSMEIAIYPGILPEGEPERLPLGCDVSWALGHFTAGKELYSACRYRGLVKWDFAQGDWIEVIHGQTRPETVGAASFSRDEPLALLYDLNGLGFWNIRGGARLAIGFDEEAISEITASSWIGFSFIPGSPFIIATGLGLRTIMETGLKKPRLRREVPFELTSTAASPDGAMLATGSDDGAVMLWDSTLPRRLGRPPGTGGSRIRELALSPDGKVLAVGGNDGLLMLWDVDAQAMIGKPLSGRLGYPGRFTDAYFAEGGVTIEVVNPGNSLERREAFTGRVIDRRSTRYAQPQIEGVYAGNTHARIYEGTVEIVDFLTGDAFGIEALKTREADGDPMEPGNVTLGADGRWLAVAYPRGEAVLVNVGGAHGHALATGAKASEVLAPGSVLRKAYVQSLPAKAQDMRMRGVDFRLSVSNDGTRAAISNGADLVLWTRGAESWRGARLTETVLPLGPVPEPEVGTITSLVLSPDGALLAAVTSAGVTVWTLDDLSPRYLDIPVLHSKERGRDKIPYSGLGFSPDSRSLAIRGTEGYVVWDAASGAMTEPFSFPTAPDSIARFSGDGELLMAISPNALSVWALGTGHLVTSEARHHRGDVRHLAFDGGGRRLVSATVGGEVLIWDIENPKEPARLEFDSRVRRVLFGADGDTLVAVDTAGVVHARDPGTGATLPSAALPDAAGVLAFDASGALRGWASDDGLWLRRDGDDRLAVPIETDKITRLAVQPGGGLLASYHGKGSIAIWEPGSERPFLQPLIGLSSVDDIRFAADGVVTVLGGDIKGPALWRVHAAPILERACSIANRSLTPEERESFLSGQNDGETACADLSP